MKKVLFIDEMVIGDHSFLRKEDGCFYFFEYTARKGYNYSEGNKLIINFKKSVTFRKHDAWRHKLRAINQIAELIKELIIPNIDFEVTFVPIPPSKSKQDKLYDDRMMQALNIACSGPNINNNVNLRELIHCRDSKDASHEQDVRPTIQELQDNMYLDENMQDGLSQNIFLFDDVITTGAHFIACKNLILQRYPEASVFGFFVARRAIEKQNLADLFDLEDLI